MINEDRQSDLEQIILDLAANHSISPQSQRRIDLLERLPVQTALLQRAYQHFLSASDDAFSLTQGAEWLLDNYYLVQQVQRQVQEDLPVTYYRELPALDESSVLAGYPRTYALAREIVLHEAGQLDAHSLPELVKTYQRVTPLTMGEVWVVPTMLRFCLLESLAQASGHLCNLITENTKLSPALHFDYKINDDDVIAAAISSLRLLNNVDWKAFFETVNPVEQILCHDPGQIYTHMDFDSRNQCRQIVEDLAKTTGQLEVAVAQYAMDLAQAAYDNHDPQHESLSEWDGLRLPLACHVSYYLLGEGRSLLEQRMHYKPPDATRIRRWVFDHATSAYLGGIGLFTLMILVFCVGYAIAVGGTLPQYILTTLLILIPAVSVAVCIVNWGVSHTIPPRVLPKLDFRDGIPTSCRTMVVVPALLSSTRTVRSLISQLEQHYLRNEDLNLSFALLTDFVDAPHQAMPEDDKLLAEVKSGVEALNERYPVQPFYLFHRPRLWNASEGVWMGWERKRGKLREFNRLLLEGTDSAYSVKVGDLTILSHIRYVITLDADTILPFDSARRLVGTLAHPLNQAQFDPVSGRVVAGYTVLQPRIEITPTSVNATRFARISTTDNGVDLYTLAVSDVYQDLFGEGVYAGKGIYDIRSFERSLEGQVPENSLLSHDLFEGIYGRTGLETDVILYEDFPPSYLAYTRRLERWIRGDWQLLPWLLGRTQHGVKRHPDLLALIDYWKITDNLRRSMLAPAFLLLLVCGWLWLPGSPFVWTLISLILPGVLFFTGIADGVIRSFDTGTTNHLTYSLRSCFLRWLLWLATLPYETWLATKAISITLLRMLVTGRHLLQWTTSAATAATVGKNCGLRIALAKMWGTLFIPIAVGVFIVLRHPVGLLPASPILVLWLLAPVLVAWMSQPIVKQAEQLDSFQRKQLRALARHTWLYFEHFGGPEDNWLPPDHYQEAPREAVAHRTSPTNIGLYLLSMLSAHDLGYMGTIETAFRLHATIDTLTKLERYRGHFYNWIDTRSLRSLSPAYISTVDSGNLAGCLIALKQGCFDVQQTSLWRWERWQGLLDLLNIFSEAVAGISEQTITPLQQHVGNICQQVDNVRDNKAEWLSLLLKLSSEDGAMLDQLLIDLVNSGAGILESKTIHDIRIYVQHIHQHLNAMHREVDVLLPWLLALQSPPRFFLECEMSPALHKAWEMFQAALHLDATLSEVADTCQIGKAHLKTLQSLLDAEISQADDTRDSAIVEAVEWCTKLSVDFSAAQMMSGSILEDYETIARKSNTLVREMDFTFLFDPSRQVFRIGFNLDMDRLDPNAYDLLASEARIASLIAIARRDVPQSHWLHLARPLTRLDGEAVLLSWSGTMFEYLMPPLLMRDYEGALLAQSCAAVVDYQIAYGKQHDVPWGISESGYYAFDPNMNHQYQAFGVPGLGFKRGLAENLVITPYASLLALPFNPAAVFQNLTRLKSLQVMSRYGLYEAADYTRSRLSLGQDAAIVKSHMSHHQGMIMVALLNYLQAAKMVRRFHADPLIQSVELLLQEQIPQQLRPEFPHEAPVSTRRETQPDVAIYPWTVELDTPTPLVHCLANGQYTTVMTNSGGGYSRWKNIALTRWYADTTLDNWGQWLYVQDPSSDTLWSVGAMPAGSSRTRQEVKYHPHMVELSRHDHNIALNVEIIVVPNADVEIRRIRITNETDQQRHLRLTSYGEVVLAVPHNDRRHPAFAKLFVESEYLKQLNALLFRRRPRSSEESPVFLLHMLVVEASQELTQIYETDRARFLGRGNTIHDPAALHCADGLTKTVGATLDPIMAISQDVDLDAYSSLQLAFITTAASTRAKVVHHAEHYQTWSAIDHAFNQAATQAQRELRELDLTVSTLEAVQQLLGLLIYPHHALRAKPDVLAANCMGQSGLWRFGISGDYPLLLLQIQDETQGELLDQVLRAHTYWRRHGFEIDLVILNQQEASYGQPVQEYIRRIIYRTRNETWLNRRGGIFVLQQDQLSDDEYILLQTVARVVLHAGTGNLSEQLSNIHRRPAQLPGFRATVDPATLSELTPPLVRPDDLLFDNGSGGFSPDGREYIIYLDAGETTPAPWINVIANPELGFLVSESSLGSTWAVNSGENRLTSWSNDPVSDRPAEAVYLRDEETTEVWSPTPQPAPANASYLIQHGTGYSIFTHHSHGLKQRLRVFAAPDAPIKIVQLYVENCWQRPRRITVTYYAEWVLGTTHETTQQYIVPIYVPENSAFFVRNPYSMEFSERVAFLAASKQPHGLTADRTEFLGRLGTYQRPAALTRIGLNNRVEAGLDPCAVLQLHLDLPPGSSEEIYYLIGQADDLDASQHLVQEYQNPELVEGDWKAAARRWDDILGAVIVDTPDTAMNLLLNRWLLYQTLSSRVWGRSAFYQSSGAYGFRDQLQDVMALFHTQPELARDHILRAARHQFEEGDVLHWWHPPASRGVRTRISDDLLWLPYVTNRYITATGDVDILNETVPFLQGSPLAPEEEERYAAYESTEEHYTVYEHCWRAIHAASTSGKHGLPLIGSGDWNDGMNRVGIKGSGESVWLGWFLYTVLTEFTELCQLTGHTEHISTYQKQAAALQQALEAGGWDGEWYRRAYFDDGTPLGSAENDECYIDALAQSWSVISGVANPDRAAKSMQALLTNLVRWDERLILLLAPPFDKTAKDPGYIKGYLPGIRENGGQYTHAAIWSIWAFAKMGQGDMAYKLFQLINPIYRADTLEKVHQYRVEPYVISADVYGVEPHIGRGGWTWYTGSSAWMYRLGIEMILGIRRHASALSIDPCIPASWRNYTVTYRYGNTTYHIHVENPDSVNRGVQSVILDGDTRPDNLIPLLDNVQEHRITIRLGSSIGDVRAIDVAEKQL